MDYFIADLEGQDLRCELCGCSLSVATYDNNQGICDDCLEKQ